MRVSCRRSTWDMVLLKCRMMGLDNRVERLGMYQRMTCRMIIWWLMGGWFLCLVYATMRADREADFYKHTRANRNGTHRLGCLLRDSLNACNSDYIHTCHPQRINQYRPEPELRFRPTTPSRPLLTGSKLAWSEYKH